MGPSHFAIKTYLENIGKKHREYKKKDEYPQISSNWKMISRVVKRRELSHGIRRKSRATWFPADTKVPPLGSLWVFASAETTLNHAWNQQQQNLNFQPKVGSSWWLRLNQPHLAKICNKVKLDRIISKESSG